MENPRVRDLLLRLLPVAEGGRLPVTEAVKGCALFGISENNARVALARLVTAGLVEAVERGVYRLGPRGQALGADILAWRQAEQRTRAWSGAWVAVHTSALGRTDRPALRTRQRLLAMAGLRELDTGLFVRPDNMAGGVAALRERLQALGLPRQAVMFQAAQFDEEREARARRLWNVTLMERSYAAGIQKLERSLASLPRLALDVAAREAYLLGDEGIHQLVFDPMLPEPLVDVRLRRAYGEMVKRYDDAGRRVWRRFMDAR
jgi:phenylacetic acid degradation operon negative regulatory protein